MNVLNDENRPFSKRLHIANNAFRSPELPLHHKEAFLLYWLLKKIDKTSEECWKLLNEWLKSIQFQELNRIDMNREEITRIVEVNIYLYITFV